MIVSKFGGTSVGSAKNIQKVIKIISNHNEKTAVVVSALGGITNLLIQASDKARKADTDYKKILEEIRRRHTETLRELFPDGNPACNTFVEQQLGNLEALLNGVFLLEDLSEKSLAKIVSKGEILSSFIIAEAFKEFGQNARLKDSRELIKTDNHYAQAAIHFEATYNNIAGYFQNNPENITVLPGFIASDERNETTTLGRGGSDFTAAIIANATNASVLEIWTDVSGMFTAHPKLVKQAKPIQRISYQEAMELSHFGAKVIYPPTIQPALDKKIPILIKNTLDPDAPGTLIEENGNGNESTVKGISHIEDISLLTLEGNGMVGVPGISKRLFEALSNRQINVKFITQASSEHSITLAIDASDAAKAETAVNTEFEYEILQHKVNPLVVENDLAIIALVGDKMKSHQGISGKMFSELGYNNVNIRAIAQGSTEKNISAVINKRDIRKALNTLHAAFFEDHIKELNLFITGVGNVGSKLLEQIRNQQEFLLQQQHLKINVIGLANSKKMYFDENGIDLNNWKELLNNSKETSSLEAFYTKVRELNLRNSVFVDNTANNDVPRIYPKFLKDSVAVVACNKVACSSELEFYKELKYLSRKYRAPFLFETNVGAGLPVIDTLNNLIASGDKVTQIQAVLSGSLNFIFNNFNENNTFYEVVKRAGDEGYTEPDPRIDLSGIDVMRKILILIRESGFDMELSDIENESFLPEGSLESDSVEAFMQILKEQNEHFEHLRTSADRENARLKYVAEFNKGKAKVGLKKIPEGHPFYDLDGKDNIVLFYTQRYQEQPLIIKGAGAGADVTASGIFGDIIRTGNR